VGLVITVPTYFVGSRDRKTIICQVVRGILGMQ